MGKAARRVRRFHGRPKPVFAAYAKARPCPPCLTARAEKTGHHAIFFRIVRGLLRFPISCHSQRSFAENPTVRSSGLPAACTLFPAPAQIFTPAMVRPNLRTKTPLHRGENDSSVAEMWSLTAPTGWFFDADDPLGGPFCPAGRPIPRRAPARFTPQMPFFASNSGRYGQYVNK